MLISQHAGALILRYEHLVPPLDFLPIIEGTELEIKIGGGVVNEALKQLEDWHQQGIKIEVSVNVASHHLGSNSFISGLEELLAQYPAVKPRWLQLEILESSALGDLNVISRVIKTCQEGLGVQS